MKRKYVSGTHTGIELRRDRNKEHEMRTKFQDFRQEHMIDVAPVKGRKLGSVGSSSRYSNYRTKMVAFITCDGDLNLSAKVVEELGTPPKVNLFVDTDGRYMGVEPATYDDPGAYTVPHGNNRSKNITRISARGPIQELGILSGEDEDVRVYSGFMRDGIFWFDLYQNTVRIRHMRVSRPRKNKK